MKKTLKVLLIHSSSKNDIIKSFMNHMIAPTLVDEKIDFSVMDKVSLELQEDYYVTELRNSIDKADVIVVFVDNELINDHRFELIRNHVFFAQKAKYCIHLEKISSRLPRFKERIDFSQNTIQSEDSQILINDNSALDVAKKIIEDLERMSKIKEIKKHSFLLFLYILIFIILSSGLNGIWHGIDDYAQMGVLASLLASLVGGFGFWAGAKNFIERIILITALSLVIGVPWGLYAAIINSWTLAFKKKAILSLVLYVVFCLVVIVLGQLMTWFRKSEPVIVDTLFGITVPQKQRGIRVRELFWIVFLFPFILEMLVHGLLVGRVALYLIATMGLYGLLRYLNLYDESFYDHPIDTVGKFTAGPREFGAFLIICIYISQLISMATKLVP